MSESRSSVRVPLVLAVVVVATALIAGLIPAISSYSAQREEAVTTAQNSVITAADSARERIRNFFAERSSALSCFANDPTLDTDIGLIIEPQLPEKTKGRSKSASSDEEEEGEEGEEEESTEELYTKAMESAKEKVATRLKTFCEGQKSCKRVIVSNETNNIIVSTAAGDKGGSFGGTLIHSTLESPVPVVLMSKGLEETMDASAVVAARTPNKQYAIVAAFDTADLFDGLNKLKASLGGTSRILVVDNRRTPLLGELESQKGKTVEIEPVTRALKGESGFATTADEDDQVVLAAFRPIGEAGIATAVMRRVDDAQNASGSFSMGGVIGGLVIGLIGAAIVFFLGRRSLESISLLYQASQRVATGDLNERVPVMSEDEVGAISRVFNDILAQLQEARGDAGRPPPAQRPPPMDEEPPIGGGLPPGDRFPF